MCHCMPSDALRHVIARPYVCCIGLRHVTAHPFCVWAALSLLSRVRVRAHVLVLVRVHVLVRARVHGMLTRAWVRACTCTLVRVRCVQW